MKSYTCLMMITLTTAWTTWYQASEYACAITAWLFRSIAFMAILTYLLGKEARVFIQPYIDSTKESCIDKTDYTTFPALPSTPTPTLTTVAEPAGIYPVQAQIQQFTPTLADFTSAELKAIAKEHKLPRYSRMNKTELFNKLLELDLI